MTNNIMLDNGGTNQLTIYTTFVEELMSNALSKLILPTGTANSGSGPKDTKIINLLKILKLFTIDGKIASADRTKLRNLFDTGKMFTLVYDSTNYTVVIEKLSIKEEPEDAGSSSPEYYVIKVNCVIGVSI